MITLPLVLIYVLVMNLIAFVRFWQDKRSAIAGAQRIPEAALLGLALLGGSVGALLARHLFRHKTRKQPLSTYLELIAGAQLCAVVGLLVYCFA